MMTKNKLVDDYILKAKPFAQTILIYLREIIESANPDLVETVKWGFPNYTHNETIICSMSSFKEHCSFGFWLGAELPDPDGILNPVGKTAMGHLGRITTLEDLPSKEILVKYIQTAIGLSSKGTKRKLKNEPSLKPDYRSTDFSMIFEGNSKQAEVFDSFSPSQRREYISWIDEAKTDETRIKRISTMLDWLLEGKTRNWKYTKK